MKRVFLPLVVARLIVSGRKTVFCTTNEEMVVEAPRKLIQQLVTLCDGRRSIDQIVELLKGDWDELSVRSLVNGLRRRHILVDGRQISDEAWKLVESPTGVPFSLNDKEKTHLVEKALQRQREGLNGNVYKIVSTSYIKLLERRHSIRSFSGDVPLQNIVNMLWSAYGEINNGRRTVPSAGALYPLKIHVALLRKTENLIPAIYHVYLGLPRSIGFGLVSTDINRFARSFTDPIMFEGAHGVIVISGSFRVTAEKYGSRSMLFVPLEAGHAAQNINIVAVEYNIATVEIGGFKEILLAEAINLPKYYHPLITVIFGCEGYATKANASDKKTEIRWNIPAIGRYRPPFAIASARVSQKRSWSHGRDALPSLAYTKAVAEAKEWAACGNIPNNLVRAAFVNLETAIDPRNIIKFHPAQYRLKGFPFKPFDEKMNYEWTEGYDEATGSVIHILADLVYFPYFPKIPCYAYANSSGVAAHPDRQKAVETSTLELIERDSFMIAYLTRLQFPTVRGNSLPESIRKRIRELRKVGFQVWIKDHSLDLAPVVCVIVQGKEFTYTAVASCASFNVEYALDHALMEAEALVLARLQNGPAKSIKPQEVIWPLDHGRLYGQRQYFHHADFLIRSQNKITFQDIGKEVAQSWQELLSRFTAKGWRLFTIPLYLSDEYGGNGDLHIIRSIVPGMVPMTFGFRQEPAGMERTYVIARELGNREFSYRELTKFPHPFA